MSTVGYIAATIPARIDRGLAHTTLFHVAMIENGDPLQWVAIAEINGMIDPWIFTLADILIPPVWPAEPVSGILGL